MAKRDSGVEAGKFFDLGRRTNQILEEVKMKNIFRQISSLVLASALVVLFQSFVFAQSDKSDVSSIEGVWRTTVTPRVCATGAPITTPFPGILLFEKGGTMTGTSTAVTSVYGLWSRATGAREYSFSSLALRYDQAAGTLLGTRRIDQTVTLGANGDTFTTSGTFQDHDLAGNPTASGCSTSVGTRFQR